MLSTNLFLCLNLTRVISDSVYQSSRFDYARTDLLFTREHEVIIIRRNRKFMRSNEKNKIKMNIVDLHTWAAPALAATHASANVSMALWKSILPRSVWMSACCCLCISRASHQSDRTAVNGLGAEMFFDLNIRNSAPTEFSIKTVYKLLLFSWL